MSRHASSYSSGVAVGSFERVDQSVSTIMSNISKVSHFLKVFTSINILPCESSAELGHQYNFVLYRK